MRLKFLVHHYCFPSLYDAGIASVFGQVDDNVRLVFHQILQIMHYVPVPTSRCDFLLQRFTSATL
jgi:hypothetical protein